MNNLTEILQVNWGNGVFMLGVFALVVIILIGLLINFMSSNSKK